MAAPAPDVNSRFVSRRNFLRLCALASGGLAQAVTVGPQAASVALAQTSPKKGGTLRVGFYVEAATMDPHLSGSKVDRQIYHNIYEPLLVLDTSLGIKPGLAESWQQPDPKTLVMKLRRGVKFHDGTDFNAEAAKFNFNRMKTEPKSVRKGEVASIESVDAVDPYTIKINLKRPDAALLATLTDRAGMMVSPKAAKELGDKFGTRPVCSGPFKFVERVAQGKIVLERFPDYWDKANIKLDRVEFVPITDSTSRLASLRSGDLHMIERVSPTDLAELRGDSRLKVAGVPELGYQVIPFNVNNGPKSKALADVRVRQAIDLAIDRETIVKTVFNNEYIPGNQWVSPSSFYYNAKLPVRKRDVAKAKQLLREAGQPNLTFTLTLPPERDRQEAALVIQAMLAEAGITMKLQTQENVTMLTAGRNGDFEAYFTFWSGRPDPDGNIFTHATCKGAQNDSRWCNADFDALVTKARHVADPAERKKLYDPATEILLKEGSRLVLWHRRVFTGLSARVQGFTPHPDGIIRLRGLTLN
jgi:peptide/nickel transport system substrate-binding protein